MMLGIGAIRSTLIAAICITPFRAWRGGPFPMRPAFNDAPEPCATGGQCGELDEWWGGLRVLAKAFGMSLGALMIEAEELAPAPADLEQ
jgi:hypothetical protein